MNVKKLHAKLITSSNLYSNPSTVLKLIRGYAPFGELRSARHLFDEILEKDIELFSVMLRSYVWHNQYKDALCVFKSMSSLVTRPSFYTFPDVLTACSWSDNLWVGLEIHATVCKIGMDMEMSVGNGLVGMYGKCGCFAEARKVLDGMPLKDTAFWNSMVDGYTQKGHSDDALRVCNETEILGMKPDGVSDSVWQVYLQLLQTLCQGICRVCFRGMS